ncbi:MAG TPA: CopG family transcriptional regulator [Acidimicrobiia bacterium]|nr:CopG family transcriptional regulator [Acidimicrobiia bacterium]
MRTTVEFDGDTTAAIQKLRRETGMGVSEAVNELVRRGLLARRDSVAFVQKTYRLGLRIDVSNVAEALEVLEGPDAR